MTPLAMLLAIAFTTGVTTYKSDCTLTTFPLFGQWIRQNPHSFTIYISTYPLSHENIQEKTLIIQYSRSLHNVRYKVCRLVVNIDRGNVYDMHMYPRWSMWKDVSSHKDMITSLIIYCPPYTSWDIYSRTFPIQGLNNLIALTLICPIRNIHETFFKGLTQLFDLHLQSHVLTSVHPNAFTHIPKLGYISIWGYLPSSTLIFDIFCPLTSSLEHASWYMKGSYSLFNKTGCTNSFNKLSFISAIDDHLQHITNTTFQLFPSARIIELNSPSLRHIDEHSFDSLTQLDTLKIHHGNIDTPNMPEIVQNLTKLKRLWIEKNNIHSIKGRFGKNIQFINLQHNRITNIPNDTFIDAVNLKQLYLNINNISVIQSDTFQSQTSLNLIELSNNFITTLEAGCFKSFFRLQKLMLSHNLLTRLTPDMFKVITKRYHLLSRVNIYKAVIKPNTITSLESLHRLDLSYNLIVDIHVDTFNLPRLQQLNLRHNHLSHLPPHVFQNLPKLQYLYLSDNHIHTIPEGLFHNLPLLELDLSTNNLTTLPCDLFRPSHLSHQSQSCSVPITIIYLNNNQLRGNALCFLSNRCQPQNHTVLQKLTTLQLDNNSLTFINASDIVSLPALRNFSFSNNPLRCSCDLVPFGVWVKTSKTRILTPRHGTPMTLAKCVSDSGVSHKLVNLPDDLNCTETVYKTQTLHNYRVIISLCVSIAIMTTIAIFCGYFRMEIAALLYAKTGFRMRRHNPEFVNKRYNVMIWCHDRDIGYANAILQVLERSFTVYWNQRDCMPGQITERGFENGIMASERVIVILTRNFVTDYHCQLKFESMHVSIGNRDFSAVFIVADNDVITQKQRIYSRVRGYLRTRQYLRHDDRLFWKKLLYKLPPPRENAEPLVYGDLVRPHINFNGQESLREMLDLQENNATRLLIQNRGEDQNNLGVLDVGGNDRVDANIDHWDDNHFCVDDNLDRVDNHYRMENIDREDDDHYRVAENIDRVDDNHYRVEENIDRVDDNHYRVHDNLDREDDDHYRVAENLDHVDDNHYHVADNLDHVDDHYRVDENLDHVDDNHYRADDNIDRVDDNHYRVEENSECMCGNRDCVCCNRNCGDEYGNHTGTYGKCEYGKGNSDRVRVVGNHDCLDDNPDHMHDNPVYGIINYGHHNHYYAAHNRNYRDDNPRHEYNNHDPLHRNNDHVNGRTNRVHGHDKYEYAYSDRNYECRNPDLDGNPRHEYSNHDPLYRNTDAVNGTTDYMYGYGNHEYAYSDRNYECRNSDPLYHMHNKDAVNGTTDYMYGYGNHEYAYSDRNYECRNPDPACGYSTQRNRHGGCNCVECNREHVNDRYGHAYGTVDGTRNHRYRQRNHEYMDDNHENMDGNNVEEFAEDRQEIDGYELDRLCRQSMSCTVPCMRHEVSSSDVSAHARHGIADRMVALTNTVIMCLV